MAAGKASHVACSSGRLEKSFQDEPSKEKPFPRIGQPVPEVLMRIPYFLSQALPSPGLGFCSVTTVAPNNRDYKTVVLRCLFM